MRGYGLLRFLVIGPVCASPLLAGAEIYKWIGPDGVTHYSESAPGSQSAGVETLELGDVALPETAPADYRRALEVAKTLEAGRLERERLRLERQRLRGEQAQAADRDQRRDAETTRYYPVYPYYHRYPRKHLRHEPVPLPHRHPRDYHGPGRIQARVPGMTRR